MLRIGTEGQEVEILHSILSLYFKLEVNSANKKVFGSETKRLVQKFQAEKGLVPDGLVGEKTLAMLYGVFSSNVLSPNKISLEPKTYIFSKCETDKYIDSSTRKLEGFLAMHLREDVAKSFNEAAQEMRSFGAIVTTAGGRRWFSAVVSANRSSTSLHYAGLAFDFAVGSAMQNINQDPYVVQRIAPRTYKVYARCNQEKVTNENFPKEKTTIKNCVTYFDRIKGKTCKEDYFIDVTALLDKYGFKPIRAREAFESNPKSSMTGAEWWHFQKEDVLVKNVSTFGGELLKIATESEIKKYPHLWSSRNRVWQKDWF